MKFLKRSIIGLLIMFGLFSLLGCGGGNGGAGKDNSAIVGTVIDDFNGRNYPVIGATIQAGGVTVKTDDNGRYTISGLPEGTVSVSMTAPQYASKSSSVTVVKGQSAVLDFTMQPVNVVTANWELFGSGSTGSGDNDLDQPVSMFEGGDGKIYVADMKNNRIQVFDPVTKQSVFRWGGVGSGPGQYNEPYGLALDGFKMYIQWIGLITGFRRLPIPELQRYAGIVTAAVQRFLTVGGRSPRPGGRMVFYMF